MSAHAKSSPSRTAKSSVSKCAYVLGEDGLARWSQVSEEAWIGLLETHKQLTRALDAELEAEHGLSLSGLEVLGRLAAAEGRCMRLTELAGACALSLSRISRIIDALEERRLVERRPVASDARAVEAHLTEAGRKLVCRAQGSHFASVQRRFFAELSDEEVASLASIFSRFVPREIGACTGSK